VSPDPWRPPSYGLLQERYWPDAWKMLMCCLCLNLTTRKQVEPVVTRLFERWPSAKALCEADDGELSGVIRSLGMWKKRTRTLKRFSEAYDAEGWSDVSELPGVGKYARDSHMIFSLGRWREVSPKDHALSEYHARLLQDFGGTVAGVA